jgi:hypothetical protein
MVWLRDGGSRLGVWCFYRSIMAWCRISVARRESVDVKVVVTLFVTRMTLPESEDRKKWGAGRSQTTGIRQFTDITLNHAWK